MPPRLVNAHPQIIDFAESLAASSRLEFYGHLVSLQRFGKDSTSRRYSSIDEVDRASVLYYILTQSDEDVSRLSKLLDAVAPRAAAPPGGGPSRALPTRKEWVPDRSPRVRQKTQIQPSFLGDRRREMTNVTSGVPTRTELSLVGPPWGVRGAP